MKRRYYAVLIFSLLPIAILLIGSWSMGSILVAAAPSATNHLPNTIDSAAVQFPSASGSQLKGWLLTTHEPSAAVILLHPLRSNRNSMLARAEFLVSQGFVVLLFDFQAHGESPGQQITFGHLESLDAIASVKFMQSRYPTLPIIAIGSSLGGAASILAEPPLPVAGLILEAVYPTIETAVANRLQIYLGYFGKFIEPLLLWQLNFRLGISPQQLRPIAKAAAIKAPVLIISGSEDQRTTLADTQALYAAFNNDKDLWIVPGARHQDLYHYVPEQYRQRVIAFIEQAIDSHLRTKAIGKRL